MWKSIIPSMQNWTGCNQLSQHQVVELIDSRDNNKYTVSKLKDGKCWMTQNLRIHNYNATSADSDVDSEFQIPAADDQADSEPKICSHTHKTTVHLSSDYQNRGLYYSYYASTAGTGDYALSSSSGTAPKSICPRNWKLPTKQDADSLVSKYSYSEAISSPLNFTLMGWYSPNENKAYSDGNGTWYWTADTFAKNNNGTIHHWAYEIGVRGQQFYVRSDCIEYGVPIRCISKSSN